MASIVVVRNATAALLPMEAERSGREGPKGPDGPEAKQDRAEAYMFERACA